MTHENEQDYEESMFNERLGQHALIDQEAIQRLVSPVALGSNVLEIGVGTGNITRALATRANFVYGIEIDRKYQANATELTAALPNVSVEFADALRVDVNAIMAKDPGEWQLVSNVPFHISEPLLKRTISVPFSDLTLLLGEQLALAILAKSRSDTVTRLGVLAQAFYTVEDLGVVPKTSFYPAPRTDGHIIHLTPLEEARQRGGVLAVLRRLFETEGRNQTIRRVLKEVSGKALDEARPGTKTERNRFSRRDVRRGLQEFVTGFNHGSTDIYRGTHTRYTAHAADLPLPNTILDAPFSHLSNAELRQLLEALHERYSGN